MKIFYFILFLFICILASAQVTLSGKLTDEQEQPIEFSGLYDITITIEK